jgi:hypothetical protein
MSLYFNPQAQAENPGPFSGACPSVLHLLGTNGVDDIFGDDPNTVYVRMNVSSEKFKGD